MSDPKSYRPGQIGFGMHEMLTKNGMWPVEADAVIATVGARDDDVRRLLLDDETGYQVALLAVVWRTIKDAALEWIDEHEPKHFARPMFTDSAVES